MALLFRFKITMPATATSFANKACGDVSHGSDTHGRCNCAHQKSIFLYEGAKFALIHCASVGKPGHLMQAACPESRALLQQKMDEKAKRERKAELKMATKDDGKAFGGGTTSLAADFEEVKIDEDISKPAPPAEAHVKASSYAMRKLEEQAPISISTSPYASDAAIHHGIFPTATAAAAKPGASSEKALAVPGSFPFDGFAAAEEKARIQAKLAKLTKKRQEAEEWEVLEGEMIEDDYVEVDASELL